jgi:threonine-phosphate decarboxylase
MDESLHGGRIHAAARELGIPPEDFLDFSANLNPLGPPEGVMSLLRNAGPELVAAYPDSEAPQLRALLTARHEASDASLVLGSGSASLLFLVLRAMAPRRVILPQPCFREQPRAVAACGAELVPVRMENLHLDLDALEGSGGDALILTNPHNPTGQLLSRMELSFWIQRHPDVAVIVDEAFMDFAPQESLLPEILARPRTVVLRSLTKFYAMPGLRVGFALADPATAARMTELQEGWPVGQLELMAAEAALQDAAYERRSLSAFAEDLPTFRNELATLGLFPLPGHAPFLLVPVPGSGTALAARLAVEGILVRTCAQWPGLGDGYLRLALRRPPDRRRLIEALGWCL